MSASAAAEGLQAWHAVVATPSAVALDALLAPDVVFHSPIAHTPQVGPERTKLYLLAAFRVLSFDRPFRYVREILGPRDAMLEFETEIDGIRINGIDLIRFDHRGRIVEFKVMLRPLKAIQIVQAKMAAMLETLAKP